MALSDKKIILHIGGHKTGSTSLQCYLMDNREQLKAEGIYYPRIPDNKPTIEYGRNNKVNGFILQNKYYCPDALDNILDIYKNDNSIHTLILSEENLFYADFEKHGFHSEALDKLRQQNTHVLVCLRRSVEYLCGAWQEQIKFAFRRKLTSALDHDDYINSLLQLHKYSELFGHKNLHLELYNPHNEENYEVMPQMLRALGVKNIDHIKMLEPHQNQALSRAHIDARYYVNQYTNYILTRSELEAYRFIFDYGSKQSTLNSLSDERIKQVCDRHYPFECEIARTFLGRETLFENRYPRVYQSDRESYSSKLSPFKKSLLRAVVRNIIIKSTYVKPTFINKTYIFIWSCIPMKWMIKLLRYRKRIMCKYVWGVEKESQLALKIMNSFFKPFRH
jgi:hypothetical protein